MNRLPLTLTVVVLAAIVAVLLWLRRPEAPDTAPDPRVGAPLLDAATVTAAQQLTLTSGENSTTLEKQADGTWTVSERFDLPADFDKLRRLVGELSEAKVTRFVTAASDRLARLELGRATVTIHGAGTPTVLRFGRTSSSGSAFLTFSDQYGPAYETPANPWIDASPAGWVQKKVLSFTAAEVARARFAFPGELPDLVASRSAAGEPWTVGEGGVEGQFRQEEVDRFLGQYLNASFSEAKPLTDPDAAAALAAAEDLFTVTLFDGREFALRIGRRPAPPAPEPPPVPEGTEPGDVETPPAPPAGPVFIFYTLPEGESPWRAPLEEAALEYYEYLYTSRPKKPTEFFGGTAGPPMAAPTTSTERPGSISVVTDPIAVPPWNPPAAPAEPAPDDETPAPSEP